jgi:hypothetical protein
LENLKEMDKYVDPCDPPKLRQDINYLNRCIMSNETEAIKISSH